MAGDWMKIEKDTPEKPEILAMADKLGIAPEEVFGRCFRIWRWADSQTADGNVRGVTGSTIDRLAGLPGFSQALIEVGWLHARTGSLQLPNFNRHMGQSAKTRALTAIRVERSRSENGNAGVTLGALPEKRREEKSKEPPKPPYGSEAFRAAWDDWVQHRKEKGVKLTPLAIRKQFKLLAEMGEPRALAAIEFSIAQCYQGIFEPTAGKAKPPPVARKVESKDETARKLAEMREYEAKAAAEAKTGVRPLLNGIFKPAE